MMIRLLLCFVMTTVLGLVTHCVAARAKICLGLGENSVGCPPGMQCLNATCQPIKVNPCPYEHQIEENGNCLVVAGGACETAHPCINGATCNATTSNCECDEGLQEKPSGMCFKIDEDTCTEDTECPKALGYSCIRNKCTCTSFGTEGPCFKDYGSACSSNKECAQHMLSKGLLCIDNVCKCKFGEEYNQLYNPLGLSENPSPMSTYFGRCEIPLGRRCVLENPVPCAYKYCDNESQRCQCPPNSIYNTTNNTCECKPGLKMQRYYTFCDCPVKGAEYDESAGTCKCDPITAPVKDKGSCAVPCPPSAHCNADGQCECNVISPTEGESTKYIMQDSNQIVYDFAKYFGLFDLHSKVMEKLG